MAVEIEIDHEHWHAIRTAPYQPDRNEMHNEQCPLRCLHGVYIIPAKVGMMGVCESCDKGRDLAKQARENGCGWKWGGR